jgi:hypothetical protein
MFKRIAAALYLRRISRDLSAIATALDRQTLVLTRLADRYAPADPAVDRPTVTAETGLSHLDPLDAALALAFTERTEAATGHTPDDEELAVYLADEKTTDLHKRLAERDAELAAVLEARRW